MSDCDDQIVRDDDKRENFEDTAYREHLDTLNALTRQTYSEGVRTGRLQMLGVVAKWLVRKGAYDLAQEVFSLDETDAIR